MLERLPDRRREVLGIGPLKDVRDCSCGERCVDVVRLLFLGEHDRLQARDEPDGFPHTRDPVFRTLADEQSGDENARPVLL